MSAGRVGRRRMVVIFPYGVEGTETVLLYFCGGCLGTGASEDGDVGHITGHLNDRANHAMFECDVLFTGLLRGVGYGRWGGEGVVNEVRL
jgi:hypothetical protein